MKATVNQLRKELLETKAILITLTDNEDIEQCECLIEELENEILYCN